MPSSQERKDQIKLLIAGSRTINDRQLVYDCIDRWMQINTPTVFVEEIISGGARGPDSYGVWYAKNNHIPFRIFLPDWNKYGKQAGIRRNIEMGDIADELLAIYDGESRGTKHMIEHMSNRLKKPVTIFDVKI
jgi:hypothetical protein